LIKSKLKNSQSQLFTAPELKRLLSDENDEEIEAVEDSSAATVSGNTTVLAALPKDPG